MKKIYLIIIIIVVILVIGGIYYFSRNQKSSAPQSENQSSMQEGITREGIMDDFSGKIADISPASPVLGGTWHVNRFWFPQGVDKDFYVEYEDGHIMRQILVGAEDKNNQLEYKMTAYFEPGENDWVLKRGEDKFFGALLDLYEHSEELGKWVKKN